MYVLCTSVSYEVIIIRMIASQMVDKFVDFCIVQKKYKIERSDGKMT